MSRKDSLLLLKIMSKKDTMCLVYGGILQLKVGFGDGSSQAESGKKAEHDFGNGYFVSVIFHAT